MKITKAVRDGSSWCSFWRWSLSALTTGVNSAGEGGGSISLARGGMTGVSGDALGVIP